MQERFAALEEISVLRKQSWNICRMKMKFRKKVKIHEGKLEKCEADLTTGRISDEQSDANNKLRLKLFIHRPLQGQCFSGCIHGYRAIP